MCIVWWIKTFFIIFQKMINTFFFISGLLLMWKWFDFSFYLIIECYTCVELWRYNYVYYCLLCNTCVIDYWFWFKKVAFNWMRYLFFWFYKVYIFVCFFPKEIHFSMYWLNKRICLRVHVCRPMNSSNHI